MKRTRKTKKSLRKPKSKPKRTTRSRRRESIMRHSKEG